MKKLLCFLLIIIICLSLHGCYKRTVISEVSYPMKEVDAVYDSNNNLIQQTLFNQETGEYFLKEFKYERKFFIWSCVDQRTSILKHYNTPNINASCIPLNIFYNSDLTNGPITIMNNDWAKVSIVKYLAADRWWEFGYELKVVNKTNRVISILIDGCSIMDINCKPMFSIDHIDAGNTAYFTLAWDKDTLERCYIPYIDNIDFMVRVFDNDDWDVPALAGTRIVLKK